MAAASKSRQELLLLYRAVMKAVSTSRVDVIIFYGTLLGFVRGGDFIDRDDDIDVLIAHEDLPRLMKAVDETAELRGVLIGTFPRQIYQIFAANVGPFDVYPYYLVREKQDTLVVWEGLLYDTVDIFPAVHLYFHGFKVLAPRNAHRLLQDTYGVGYMTPMQKGDYLDSMTVRKCPDVARAIESPPRFGVDAFAVGQAVVFVLVVMLLITDLFF